MKLVYDRRTVVWLPRGVFGEAGGCDLELLALRSGLEEPCLRGFRRWQKRGCLATQCPVCSTDVISTRRRGFFCFIIRGDMFCVNVVGGWFVMPSFFLFFQKRGWKSFIGFLFFHRILFTRRSSSLKDAIFKLNLVQQLFSIIIIIILNNYSIKSSLANFLNI